MPARTLVYRLLVISPILYTGAIVARSRIYIDPYVFTACTVKQQSSILAYRDVLMDSARFRGLPTRKVDPAEIRRAASRWIQGMDDGTLQALTPVILEDYARDGVKQEISRVRDTVFHHLVGISQMELEAGNRVQAARDLTMAMRLAEVMKYSDPYSVSHSGMMQRTALIHLTKVQSGMSKTESLWLRSELREVAGRQKPLEPMVRLIARLYRDAGSGPERDVPLIGAFLSKPDTADQRSVSFLASLPKPGSLEDRDQAAYVGLLRMCGSSQTMWLKQLDRNVESLDASIALVLKNPKSSNVAVVSP